MHPAPYALKGYVLHLMARNGYQVLGKDFNSPSDFLICYTEDGATKETSRGTGGTGQAIRIAVKNNIPVWNLKLKEHQDAWLEFLNTGNLPKQ